MVNPLEVNRGSRGVGKEWYEDLSNPSCVACHGNKGDASFDYLTEGKIWQLMIYLRPLADHE